MARAVLATADFQGGRDLFRLTEVVMDRFRKGFPLKLHDPLIPIEFLSRIDGKSDMAAAEQARYRRVVVDGFDAVRVKTDIAPQFAVAGNISYQRAHGPGGATRL